MMGYKNRSTCGQVQDDSERPAVRAIGWILLLASVATLLGGCSSAKQPVAQPSGLATEQEGDTSPEVVRNESPAIVWSPLHVATANGDATQVGLLLAEGADVDVSEPTLKITPLHLAAESGNVEIMDLLLARGANPNAQEAQVGATPLHVAVQNARPEVVERLLARSDTNPDAALNNGFDRGYTAVHIAVLREDADMTTRLIKAKARLDFGRDVFGPLHLAAEKGRREMVELLIDAGADVNSRGPLGLTALHRAAQQDHVEVVKLLLERGAEVDTRHDMGATPLLVASIASCPEVAKALLAKGADVNAANQDGFTPLHAVAYNGDPDLARLLLEHGAREKINTKRQGGYTPLHLAAKGGHSITTSLLIENGATIDVENDIGFTAMDLAHEYDWEEVVEVLRSNGGR